MQTMLAEVALVLMLAVLPHHEPVKVVNGHVVHMITITQEQEVQMGLRLDLGQSDGSHPNGSQCVPSLPLLEVKHIDGILEVVQLLKLVNVKNLQWEVEPLKFDFASVKQLLVFGDPLLMSLLIHLMHQAEHCILEAEVILVFDVDAALAVGNAGWQLNV